MKLSIKGDIVPNDEKWIYDWLELDAFCPRDAERAVEACAEGEALEVEISSGGGSVIAGSEIYSALASYKKGAVTIRVTGLAASAASVIAMAGRCEMAPTALLMIHNVSTRAAGDYREMEHAAGVLRTADEAIRAAYRRKTGMEEDQLSDMMDRETWITAERAVELGFADAVSGGEAGTGLQLAASSASVIGERAKAKLRGMIAAEKRKTDSPGEIARAEYEFMLMKGARR